MDVFSGFVRIVRGAINLLSGLHSAVMQGLSRFRVYGS